jgi:hypothetical protein
MNTTILFILGSIGMTHIIIDGSIFSSLREYVKSNLPSKIATLVECYMCAGFWCGVFTGLCLGIYDPTKLFSCGCAGSILSQTTAVLLNTLESITIKMTND